MLVADLSGSENLGTGYFVRTANDRQSKEEPEGTFTRQKKKKTKSNQYEKPRVGEGVVQHKCWLATAQCPDLNCTS